MQNVVFCLSLTLSILGIVSLPSSALTISWGNDLATNVLQQSDTTTLDNTFKFELGTFADTSGGQPGVVVDPSGISYSNWNTIWKPIDSGTDGAGWDPVTQTFSRESDIIETPSGSDLGQTSEIGGSTDFFADPQYDPANIPGGEKLYLWVHNGTLFGGSDATEAALITSTAWNIPDYETHTFPFAVDLGDADTAVLGSISVKDVDLRLQAVPEPTASTLVLLTAGLMCLRRKRIGSPSMLH